MNKPVHPLALFRLMVLGPLASRSELKRGEIKSVIRDLAQKSYDIPDSNRCRLSEETIQRWYYAWRRGGIDALAPKKRNDHGTTRLSQEVAQQVLLCKQDNPARSIRSLIYFLEKKGIVAGGTLSRATVHRFLQKQKLSKRLPPDVRTIERRAFVAKHAGDIWHGDVMHGPAIQTKSGMRKTYLVSLIDDASRFIVHSAFCFGETALDIENVLKQAVLKYGLPHRLIVDNGAAYRAESLQAICARLEIRLIYCKPYEPEGKGKLERFHRTFREQFINEILIDKINGIDDLNARLWAWLEQVYHARAHGGLNKNTPRNRWREDLIHIRQLGFRSEKIDDIFNHRIMRTVRRDGTISWEGKKFEVMHGLADRKIILVIDPHTNTAVRAESELGDNYGAVVLLDPHANLHRKRQRPSVAVETSPQKNTSIVDLALQKYQQSYNTSCKNQEK